MTSAIQAVCNHLKNCGVNACLNINAGLPDQLEIPALNAAIGGITVFDEIDELTVEIHGKHHSHFPTPKEAADFVAGIISERICITVEYTDAKCLS